jgi:ABC-2 type transport system permease protein
VTATATTVSADRPRATTPGPPSAGRPVRGTGTLLRLTLRRDRLRILLWTLGIAGLVISSAASVVGLYDTPESLAGYAALVDDNPAMIVQAGPGYGLSEDPTVGAVVMNELAIWTIIVVALMSAFMVSRHTRAEEESERAELLRSTPLGRHAAGTATMIAVLGTNLLVAATVVLSLVATGLDVVGSVAFGAALVGAGMVFAAITLVAAQIASSSRAATGLAMVALGLSFVLRAVGDVGDGTLSWFSPVGWAQAIRAFAGERWWVLLLPAVATVALVGVAIVLAGHRDFGSGLVPQRVGRESAPRSLSGPFGLALRLQRSQVLGWSAGVVALGFFYGVVADQAEQMLEDNPELEDFFAQLGQGSVTDAFLSVAILMVGLLAGGFLVATVLRLRTEESAGRADPVLATPTSRTRWAGAHVVAALLGMLVVSAAGGAATGLGAALSMGEPGRVAQLTGAALAMSAATAVMGGVAFLLCGVAPRWHLLAWAFLAVPVVIGVLGNALDLPDWALGVSPYDHVPAMPAAAFTALPVVLLVAVAAALFTVGLLGLRRRDVAGV